MFRIEAFCEDKRLAEIMHALNGKVVSINVLPVANASAQGGKLVAETEGNLTDMFIEYVRKMKYQTVKTTHVREYLTGIGRSAASANYVMTTAVQRGLLRKRGKGLKATYELAGSK